MKVIAVRKLGQIWRNPAKEKEEWMFQEERDIMVHLTGARWPGSRSGCDYFSVPPDTVMSALWPSGSSPLKWSWTCNIVLEQWSSALTKHLNHLWLLNFVLVFFGPFILCWIIRDAQSLCWPAGCGHSVRLITSLRSDSNNWNLIREWLDLLVIY